MNNLKPLERSELLELFKHWDTRVSHQELLFMPLSVAGLPAVAASWDKINHWMVLVVATGSIAIYLFHLFVVRRFAVFQDNVFAKMSVLAPDFNDLLLNPSRKIGVQRLRLLFLPLLGILWAVTLYASLDKPGHSWQAAIAFLAFVPAFVSTLLWPNIDAKT